MSSHNSSAPEIPAIRATNISKRFGGAIALENVGVEVFPGECHAIVGENGAGKSTFMRILAGLIAPDSGEVEVEGVALVGGARSAIGAGISLVHQELSLVPEMSVAENILLGSTPTRGGFIRSRKQRSTAVKALNDIGVSVDVDEAVGRLSVALRQFVEIARAVARNPRVLILDEPTATLTPAETEHLVDLLKRLQDQGIAILYISHRLPEVFALCSRATILRDGRLIETVNIADTTIEDVIGMVVGRELERDLRTKTVTSPGEIVLSVENVDAPKVHGATFDVRAGEIVGIGGLVGAGRSEMIRAIIGADPRSRGTVTLRENGRRIPVTSIRSAIAHGLCYVPEERRIEGLALSMTVSDNIALPNRRALSRFGVMDRKHVAQFVHRIIGEVGLRPERADVEAGNFSGGNQQKVVIGKWLGDLPKVLVVDEPTRGVDVGAKAEIHRLIRSLAEQGTAVLIVSSDLPELLELSHVIHVVRDGTIVGSIEGSDADERGVMRLAAGTRDTAA